MGIDGIGGGPGGIGGPKPGPGKLGGAEQAEQGFKVERADSVASADDVQVAELARLENGEISLDEYLDNRADLAVEHLRDRLNPEQLEIIKGQIVEQLKNDAALTRLVQRATGQV